MLKPFAVFSTSFASVSIPIFVHFSATTYILGSLEYSRITVVLAL